MRNTGTHIGLAVLLVFALIGVASGGSYIIGDEDMLQISVWGNPELSVQVPVRPDGFISVPLIGDVKAAGLTPMELKAILEKEFANYVKTPTVSVVVTAVNSFKVYVFGEGISRGAASNAQSSAQSGAITLRRDTTLMQLLAQLGSLKDADLSDAYIMREGQKLSINFFNLVTEGDLSQDIQLKPNDMIFIPFNYERQIRVVGAVKNPSILSYNKGMTALDAVLSAGGFTEFASQNSVTVTRKEGQEYKTIDVRLKDVINGDASKNVPLKPGDLVTVKTGIF